MCGLPGHGPGDLIDLSFEGDRVRVTFTAGHGAPAAADHRRGGRAGRRAADAAGAARAGRARRGQPRAGQGVGRRRARRRPVSAGHRQRRRPRADPRRRPARRWSAGRALHLHYYVPSRDERTERTVDPMRLLLVDGHWYLEAWCRRVEGVRLFRLDRVDDVAVLDEPSAPAAAGARARPGRRPLPARARVARGAAAAGPAAPGGSPTTTRSRTSRPVDDPPGGLAVVGAHRRPRPGPAGWWPRSAAPRWSTSPPELAEEVAADARAALARYGG